MLLPPFRSSFLFQDVPLTRAENMWGNRARVFEALGINRGGGGENEGETQTQAPPAKFHGTIRPERYRLVIDSQRAATLELVEKVDRYLETSYRDDQVWIEETKVQREYHLVSFLREPRGMS